MMQRLVKRFPVLDTSRRSQWNGVCSRYDETIVPPKGWAVHELLPLFADGFSLQ